MNNATALAAKRNDYKTMHVLHLLLSVISMGLWVPFWILVAISNAIERGKIDRKLGKISGR